MTETIYNNDLFFSSKDDKVNKLRHVCHQLTISCDGLKSEKTLTELLSTDNLVFHSMNRSVVKLSYRPVFVVVETKFTADEDPNII